MLYQQTVSLARRLQAQTGLSIRRAHLEVCNTIGRRPSRYRADVFLLMQEPDEAPPEPPLDYDDLPTDYPGYDEDGVPHAA